MDQLQFYVTVRSPYSYLALDRVVALAEKHQLELVLKPVYPLAIRLPAFFDAGHPALLTYLRRDAERVAQMQGILFSWPMPDPIVQDLATSEIATEQPHIRRLSRLLVAACDMGQGVQAYRAMSRLLFRERGDWSAAGALEDAMRRAGCDWAHLCTHIKENPETCDRILSANSADLDQAGHWGTPSLVFGDQLFFGQDRIEMCDWFLGQTT
ncbi:DsbA family protein [Phaeobacter sp. J2-8]|uniref:2-hydroxychromene-2-carboxylate isomerase n=1 Tax=Phaeobacter sp. J2-8 TaxID=2931394 RepID=UPI001FD2C534|nr:DsbA family protein [Phaeobacter sp. J2-8]MCJ7872755.1 DsbA family protein [Phaeobacter sp. J2-8]